MCVDCVVYGCGACGVWVWGVWCMGVGRVVYECVACDVWEWSVWCRCASVVHGHGTRLAMYPSHAVTVWDTSTD